MPRAMRSLRCIYAVDTIWMLLANPARMHQKTALEDSDASHNQPDAGGMRLRHNTSYHYLAKSSLLSTRYVPANDSVPKVPVRYG